MRPIPRVMPGCSRGSSWKRHHHRAAQTNDTIPSATNEKRQENQMIRKATTGAVIAEPTRPAEWVMPIAMPRRGERGPIGQRTRCRRQGRTLTHAEHEAHGG